MQCPQFRKGSNKLEGIQKKNERITEEAKKKVISDNKLQKITYFFFKKKNIKQEINPNS